MRIDPEQARRDAARVADRYISRRGGEPKTKKKETPAQKELADVALVARFILQKPDPLQSRAFLALCRITGIEERRLRTLAEITR